MPRGGGQHHGSRNYGHPGDGSESGGQGNRGRGGWGGRGGIPPGLRGKQIGLYFAQRGRKRREEKEKQERPVVTINQHYQENIHSMLSQRSSSSQQRDDVTVTNSVHLPLNLLCEPAIVLVSGNIQDYFRDYSSSKKAQANLNVQSGETEKLSRSVELDNRLKADLLGKESVNEDYDKLQQFRRKLPSYKAKEEIIKHIRNNQVVLISGETGCGKTTQVPQFILDDAILDGNGSLCHIICTQPRRISATSIAERVALERGEKCGEASCGYQIRLESAMPRRCGSILYCTTGVVLRRLMQDPLLTCASHIILDEVHERDLLSDFMLIITKDILPQRPDLKLILMSATLNAEVFATYFDNCPRLNIPGFTFPVEELYLEDVLERIGYMPPNTERVNERRKFHGRLGRVMAEKQHREENLKMEILLEMGGKYKRETSEAIRRMSFDKIDYELIKELIRYICLNHEVGAILIFLPGWDQISDLNKTLTQSKFFSSDRFKIIPLHSMMPSSSQKEVFDRPPPGVWKVITATNIAETSITIDDVVYVIDSGQCKEKGYDPELHMTCLNMVPISRASAKQRAGRAGRVQPGTCFHLFTRYHYKFMDEFQLPEMLRTTLESLCLQIKILELGFIETFLMKAIQPPDRESVRNSIASLQQLNALDRQENLTPLGRHLAALPIDPNIGKLILFGAIFSCLDPVLTIASSLGFKSPFVTPLNKEREVFAAKKELAGGSLSDHVMLVNAFEAWEKARRSGGDRAERDFCWDYFLSGSTLMMIKNMKAQFADLLYDIGFIKSKIPSDPKANTQSRNIKLVKAVLCAGLYPNVVKVGPCMSNHRPPKMTTLQGKVCVHLSSVNCEETDFKTKWLIYHKIMKTTKIFVYDTTMVSPFSLLFFGGNITTGMEDGDEIIKVDKWVKFHASASVADTVERLRRELDVLLDEKAKKPHMDLAVPGTAAILKAIIDLITTEEIYTMKS